MNELDDIMREFLVESNEGLDQVEKDLLALEQNPTDSDRLASVFRCVHTIKGTSGFLALPVLEQVGHAGEGVLSQLRDGKMSFTPALADTLLVLSDTLRGILKSIEATGGEGSGDHSALLARLHALQAGEAAAHVVPSAPVPVEPLATPEVAESAPVAVAPAVVATPVAESAVADSSIRVDVHLLDKLMTLVGELVLARNQVLQHTGDSEDAAFNATAQRLDLITTELQEGVMKTRMQPIGTVWSKLPRVVRDLAHACGKDVGIVLDGKETELDKTIIEAIKDPLVHIVRNAVDHGIETPEGRRAAGKSPQGTLRLRAFHEGGQVILEISDDGAGIDPEKVRRTAIRRGVLNEAQAARLSERELLALIFDAGFSTAEKVTNVSGRGVGMDVVRTNIERIGGNIDLQSRLGLGTTLRIKIPLTLAIIPALVVTNHGERYAIPQISLLELVRVEGETVRTAIERIHGAPVYRLRGQLLPLVDLGEALHVGAREPIEARDVVNIVVLRADDRQFGLVVDGVSDTEEIVVKPLGRVLKSVSAYAGATIMGDGRVALILDVLGVAQHANVITAGSRDRARSDETVVATDSTRELRQLLILSTGADRRSALPLSSVARLERIESPTIEWSGGRQVVQYRGSIMPLVDVPAWLGLPPAIVPGTLSVVVYAHGTRRVGLVVTGIIDVVEDQVTVTDEAVGGGVLAAAVVQGRVTDLLDLNALVRQGDPAIHATSEAA